MLAVMIVSLDLFLPGKKAPMLMNSVLGDNVF